jgi:hypothetical protein
LTLYLVLQTVGKPTRFILALICELNVRIAGPSKTISKNISPLSARSKSAAAAPAGTYRAMPTERKKKEEKIQLQPHRRSARVLSRLSRQQDYAENAEAGRERAAPF